MSTEEQSTASDLPQPSASNLAQAGASDLPQGDVRLLQSRTAQELLGSTELARVAYVAKDATPRVFPMLFHWTGEELVLCTFAGAAKIHAIRARPDIAVTIDAPTTPPRVLLLRGRATVDEVDGIVPEYRQAHLRYAGPEQGEANVAAVDNPGVRMARIGLRPTWVGVLDFVARLPGGVSAEEFDRRGS
ncbi:pyridoxamine 5'-phosphate oxidase family protein [Georgenia sp. TF02-10]|uniref:pyridoxamine 5'-phosphate oxidase family protein n=1 Tax=Georgenia sp. TF02-10 TaxID=2917725 RepID=UPI001FA7F752|nr:pyridoxamine 5'-phosphate oxidase family protein [Georgenia sp. TF02-10]UNX55542.1 pyridoxamine 5'-phosphate oxidase family protein [Georgenia sp. TF02-10]